jgi:hypothetical protein
MDSEESPPKPTCIFDMKTLEFVGTTLATEMPQERKGKVVHLG